MKKLSVILVTMALLVAAGSAAFAQEDAGSGMSFGGVFGYQSFNQGYEYGALEVDYKSNMLSFGLFFDATYVRFNLLYSTAIGDTKLESNAGNGEGELKLNNIDIDLLGKYPVDLGGFQVWPALGLGFSINIAAEDEDGDDLWEDKTMNDLYILAGLGCDVNVTDSVFVSPSLIFGYNLTPSADDTAPSDVDWHGWKLNLNFGVGMRF